MAGLPGSGKSALAEDLARALSVPVLSVDPIEAALLRAGLDHDERSGLAAYLVAEDIAAEQLRVGLAVIIDAVNDHPLARGQWVALAERLAVPLDWIEVTCPDPAVHRARLGGRSRSLGAFPEPSWESVEARRAAFDGWDSPRLKIDSLHDRRRNLALARQYLRL